ncbi:AAA family ATPase [Faecalibacterium taiwanense]|uniref:AAA family ATPase n=1 Tax=Faecalibacterium taiwanense TaxID=3030638 RepID=UPI0031FEA3D2
MLDPIYKVITGDENSADQMAKFCNQFDLVCRELDCAVIYCHHHSKGAQGGKRSMDRASGSGVFARDPDAMLDMTERCPPMPSGSSSTTKPPAGSSRPCWTNAVMRMPTAWMIPSAATGC